MKILHIITGLEDGGAEAVLYRLCEHDHIFHHHIVSLSDGGKYGPMLQEINIPVTTLNMSPNWPSLLAFIRLIKLIHEVEPDVVQTWMYHADFFGGISAKVAGIKVVWGIHNTILESSKSKKKTIWIVWLLARFSWWLPKKIVVCSRSGINVHKALGYNCQLMECIPNGYDLTYFQPNSSLSGEFEFSLSAGYKVPLIGIVGRFSPQKNHKNFIDALEILNSRKVNFQAIFVGVGLESSNKLLMDFVKKANLDNCVRLLGPRNDVSRIMNAIDLHVLSSSSEAFPNVVAEAMACGTPCVVTDVGDSSYIVGNTGWVVPSRNPSLLADAIFHALEEKKLTPNSWLERKIACRNRIVEKFGIDKMIAAYHEIWLRN